MTEPLGERLEDLEKAVRRAAEVIAMLRKERETLQAKLAAGQIEGVFRAVVSGFQSRCQACRDLFNGADRGDRIG